MNICNELKYVAAGFLVGVFVFICLLIGLFLGPVISGLF